MGIKSVSERASERASKEAPFKRRSRVCGQRAGRNAMQSFLVDAGRVGASAGAGGLEGRRRWRDAALAPRLLVLDDDHGELVLLDPLGPAVCARLPLASIAQLGFCEQALETASPRRPQRARLALLLAVKTSSETVIAAGPRDADGGLRIVVVPRFARDFDTLTLRIFQSPWTEQLGVPSPEANKVLASLDVQEDWTFLTLESLQSFDVESFGEQASQGPPQPRFGAPPDNLRLGISQTHICLARAAQVSSEQNRYEEVDADSDGLVLLYQEPLAALSRLSLLADAVVLVQFASGRILRFSCAPSIDVPALVSVLLGRARYLQMDQAGLIAHSVMGWFEGSEETVTRLAKLAGVKTRPAPIALPEGSQTSASPTSRHSVSPRLPATFSNFDKDLEPDVHVGAREADMETHSHADPQNDEAAEVLARAQSLLAKFNDLSMGDSVSLHSQNIGLDANSEDSNAREDDEDDDDDDDDDDEDGSIDEDDPEQDDEDDGKVDDEDQDEDQDDIERGEISKESQSNGNTTTSNVSMMPSVPSDTRAEDSPLASPEPEQLSVRSPEPANFVLASPLESKSPPPPPPSDSPPPALQPLKTKTNDVKSVQAERDDVPRQIAGLNKEAESETDAPGASDGAPEENIREDEATDEEEEEEEQEEGGAGEANADTFPRHDGDDVHPAETDVASSAHDDESQAGSPLDKTLEIANMQAARQGLSVPVVGGEEDRGVLSGKIASQQRRRRSTANLRQRSLQDNEFPERSRSKSKRRSTAASCKQQ